MVACDPVQRRLTPELFILFHGGTPTAKLCQTSVARLRHLCDYIMLAPTIPFVPQVPLSITPQLVATIAWAREMTSGGDW